MTKDILSQPDNVYAPILTISWTTDSTFGWTNLNSNSGFRKPFVEIIMYFHPDNICEALTERWVFFSGNPLLLSDIMGADQFYDEYICFDYMVKKDKISVLRSPRDLPFLTKPDLSIDTNVKEANSFGTIQFDVLMDWYKNYDWKKKCD